jgi:hypothetical protein
MLAGNDNGLLLHAEPLQRMRGKHCACCCDFPQRCWCQVVRRWFLLHSIRTALTQMM